MTEPDRAKGKLRRSTATCTARTREPSGNAAARVSEVGSMSEGGVSL